MDAAAPKPGRFLVGCVLAPVLLFAVLLTLSTVVLAVEVVFAGPTGPFAGKTSIAIVSLVIDGLLALFFVTVSRRLVSAFRGQEVPHLFPPAVGVVVGGLVGLACVGTGVASIAGATTGAGAGRALGIGVLFLGYAGHRARAWFRHRRSPLVEPNP